MDASSLLRGLAVLSISTVSCDLRREPRRRVLEVFRDRRGYILTVSFTPPIDPDRSVYVSALPGSLMRLVHALTTWRSSLLVATLRASRFSPIVTDPVNTVKNTVRARARALTCALRSMFSFGRDGVFDSLAWDVLMDRLKLLSSGEDGGGDVLVVVDDDYVRLGLSDQTRIESTVNMLRSARIYAIIAGAVALENRVFAVLAYAYSLNALIDALITREIRPVGVVQA